MKWFAFILIVLLSACSQDEPERSAAPENQVVINLPKDYDIDGHALMCEVPDRWDNIRNRCFRYDPLERFSPIAKPDLVILKDAARADKIFQCEINFSTDIRGRVYNIVSNCSDGLLNDELEKVITQLEFTPRIVRGRAEERSGDCCIVVQVGSDAEDVFSCTFKLPEDSSVCEIASKATQD